MKRSRAKLRRFWTWYLGSEAEAARWIDQMIQRAEARRVIRYNLRRRK